MPHSSAIGSHDSENIQSMLTKIQHDLAHVLGITKRVGSVSSD